MGLWKILVVAAGAAGVLGFFMPLVEYRDDHGVVTGQASAYEIATTRVDTSSLINTARQLGVPINARQANAVNRGVLAYRGELIAMYVPAALLALLGLIDLFRWRMGRFAGLLALILGAASGAVFGWFWLADQDTKSLHSSLGLGVYLLAGCSAGGMLAGLGAMFNPDRRD